ncbi:MAG: phosphoribosylglycinamide formyltransferase [Verrucomicrobia bacterium]|nr:phosphoribosylglycinamide formyltransferase [Verrucomicrobiota bacterium]
MTRATQFKLGVLGSGKGSNFVAIADACAAGRVPATIELVLSDLPEAGILDRARERGVRAEHLAPGRYRTRLDEAAERAYVAGLQEAGVDLVVLAGFMRILKGDFLGAFPGRVVNIHPSLLPAFPGLEAWKQALDHGVKVTGVTVHLVDAGVDTGPILAQAPVLVRDDDTPETLHARIQEVEHRLYPATIARWLTDTFGACARGPNLEE